MADKITVTGKVGPGNSVASLVLNDIEYLKFDHTAKTLEVAYGEPEQIQIFDISATTTITDTISGGAHTWVVSQ